MLDLDRLLRAGARYPSDDVTFVVERHPLGDVVLPTGQVVGFDPGVADDVDQPFTATVPPGAYPAVAWIAALYKEDEEWQRRVAALQLVIRDEPVASWEPALVDGDDPGELGEDEYFGYGVDTGAGTLADITVSHVLADWDAEEFESAFDPEEFPEAPVPGLYDMVVDEPSGANLIMVESGWGDGFYPTFVGRTAEGEVACFLTDFMVIP